MCRREVAAAAATVAAREEKMAAVGDKHDAVSAEWESVPEL